MSTQEPPTGQTPEEQAGATPAPPPPPPPSYGSIPGPAVPPPPASGPVYGSGANEPYSAVTAVQYGFDKFKNNVGPWIGIIAISFGVIVALSLISTLFAPKPTYNPNAFDLAEVMRSSFSPIEMVLNILITAVGYIFSAVMMRGALDETEGTKFSIGGAFSRVNFGSIIVLGIVLSIGSTIGYLLCVLPGLVFAVLTMFALPFLVDKDLNAIEAIKASFTLITSKLGESIVTILLMMAVVLAGFIACFVGLFAAIPTAQIALAYAYKRLQDQPVA